MADTRAFRKPSIKDVAKLASVSVTTVSHVVSGTPGYSAETVQKVREAIEQLNYVPSYVAKGLRQKATRTIGVCARDPFETGDRDSFSFPDRLWAGVLSEADREHYKVLHFPTSIRDSEDASEFLNGQIDGLIICASRYDQRPAAVAKAGLPVVMVARYFDIPEGISSVSTHEEAVIGHGLEYLRDLGHRKIAYVAGPAVDLGLKTGETPDDVAESRLEGYQAWMSDRVPSEAPLWAVTRNWEGDDLTETVREWVFDTGVTAVFAANDRLARWVLRAAENLGIDVPDRLSVLGIDNDQGCNTSNPPLSSIDLPIHEVGHRAVRVLLSMMQGGAPEHRKVDLLALEVTVRGSTGPCPKL